MKRIFAPLVLVCVTFNVTPASAAPITVPPDIHDYVGLGAQYRLVFVTSTTRDATSLNIEDYNAFVTGVANSVPELAALGLSWYAMAATPATTVRENIHQTPGLIDNDLVYNLRGDLVAVGSDFSVFSGGDPFSRHLTIENGEGSTYPAGSPIWVGSNYYGDMPGYLGVVPGPGKYTPVGSLYNGIHDTFLQSSLLTDNYPLFAMSAEIDIVPEPSTWVLGICGAAALGVSSLRRRRNCKPKTNGF